MTASTNPAGRLVVRFDRKRGLGFGVLFIAIFAPGAVRAVADGKIETAVILLALLPIGCWSFWSGIRARATLCQGRRRIDPVAPVEN